MIVLDTNVVSDLLRPTPTPAVETWIAAQDGADLYLTAVVAAELMVGVALLPEGRRKRQMAQIVRAVIDEDFRGRILPFDLSAAEHHAEIVAERRAIGRPISQVDAQIAAIARNQGAAVATRNIRDFEHCGLDLIDPWQGDVT